MAARPAPARACVKARPSPHPTPHPPPAFPPPQALILRAGTDVDCGSFMTKWAGSALAKGNINAGDIDTVLLRLFRVRLRLGHFETSTPLDSIGAADVCTDAGRELGRDGARQSIVLVKNANGLLPLSAASFPNAVMIGVRLRPAPARARCTHLCTAAPA